jgi:hypothetical protein
MKHLFKALADFSRKFLLFTKQRKVTATRMQTYQKF